MVDLSIVMLVYQEGNNWMCPALEVGFDPLFFEIPGRYKGDTHTNIPEYPRRYCAYELRKKQCTSKRGSLIQTLPEKLLHPRFSGCLDLPPGYTLPVEKK